MKNGTMPVAVNAKAPDPVRVLSNVRNVQVSRAGESGEQPDRTSSGAMHLDKVMSTKGVGGTQEQALDPNEQTETRTRAPVESVDEGWDLVEPIATNVKSVAPEAAAKVVSSKPVNGSKFPSAMAELAKSEPSVRAAKDVKPAESEAIASAPVKSEATALAPVKSEAIASAPVKSEAIASAPVKSEATASAPVGEVAVKSAGKLEVVKTPRVVSPDAMLLAARAKQESLLSLDAGYAVEFFSSAPPPVIPDVQAVLETASDAFAVRRSLFPVEELVARQRYFRKIVLKVMLVALGLFVFALYVMWQRGVFVKLN